MGGPHSGNHQGSPTKGSAQFNIATIKRCLLVFYCFESADGGSWQYLSPQIYKEASYLFHKRGLLKLERQRDE
jgi:hypothetical protein